MALTPEQLNEIRARYDAATDLANGLQKTTERQNYLTFINSFADIPALLDHIAEMEYKLETAEQDIYILAKRCDYPCPVCISRAGSGKCTLIDSDACARNEYRDFEWCGGASPDEEDVNGD